MTKRDKTDRGLSAPQERMIAALMSCATITEACEKVGVSRATCYRWMEQEDFDRALRIEKRRARENGLRKLAALTGKAAKAIEGVLDGKKWAARIPAARVVFEFIGKDQAEELDARLRALEQRDAEGGGGKPGVD